MSFYPQPKTLSLKQLCQGIITFSKKSKLDLDREVSDLAYDSLSLKRFPSKKRGLKIYISPFPFVNRGGKEVDPNEYIDEAISFGANIIIYKPTSPIKKREGVFYIPVSNPRKILSELASRFYGLENIQIPIFGVTGTKGKTTTSYALYNLLNQHVGKTGLTGTSDYYFGEKKVTNITPLVNGTILTCPESLELSGFVARLIKIQGKAMVIESTSHALALSRIGAALPISGGIITNIGSDHLDFHKTHQAYVKAKSKLINLIASSKTKLPKVLILNSNDQYSPYFYKYAKKLGLKKIIFVGLASQKMHTKSPDYSIEVEGDICRFHYKKRTYTFDKMFLTQFNACNYIMALALIHESTGIPVDSMAKTLSQMPSVPGRVEVITTKPFTIIVDNAHEEKSFEAMLSFARRKWQRLIVVFSCTGDRDTSKRPKMGILAAKLSDYSIITNDNPFFENPQKIVHEIEEGFIKMNATNYEIVDNRYQAIKKGVSLLSQNDALLVLGMGDEQFLEQKGEQIPWSDKQAVLDILKEGNLAFLRSKKVKSLHDKIME